jgi:hypothetical protein
VEEKKEERKEKLRFGAVGLCLLVRSLGWLLTKLDGMACMVSMSQAPRGRRDGSAVAVSRAGYLGGTTGLEKPVKGVGCHWQVQQPPRSTLGGVTVSIRY